MSYSAWAVMICVALYAKGNEATLPRICAENPSSQISIDANDAYQNATSWLLSQRMADWSWPLLSTARAILSLQITNDSWYSADTDDLTAQLSVKELEIELLADLSQAPNPGTLATISPGNLAYYIMALHSTCHDVTDFEGHDLVQILTNSMDSFPQSNFNNYFQYALALLAMCQSGASIPTAYTDEIRNGQNYDGSYQFGTDVVSMAVMAMSCVLDEVSNQVRNDLRQTISQSVTFLLGEQTDYTFGNPISTALAVQALLVGNQGNPNSWPCEEAVRSVLDAQGPDGDFGSQGGTIQILPLLVDETFASVTDVSPDCDADADGPGGDVPHITITIEVENGVDTNAAIFNINVVVPTNATLYAAMLLAVEQHVDFSFDSHLTIFGNSIDEINDVANDGVNSYYWTILIGQERESATTGVDGIITVDQELYIFFYMSFAY